MMTSPIWILACPLGMFAIGGAAWGLGRLPGRRAERLARATSRVSCMSVAAAAQRPSEDGEMTEQARADSGIPSHV